MELFSIRIQRTFQLVSTNDKDTKLRLSFPIYNSALAVTVMVFGDTGNGSRSFFCLKCQIPLQL